MTRNISVGIYTVPGAECVRCDDGTNMVSGVRIGVGFHWDRASTFIYEGDIRPYTGHESGIGFVNILPLESYLKSVISSEMNPQAHTELLKAHAVISRSWAMSRMRCTEGIRSEGVRIDERPVGADEKIVWYDHAAHTDFDVCSDDHCQRYQGIVRDMPDSVIEAVEATAGIVLCDSFGNICDARFSKCCGGVTEEFEACWQPTHYEYLVPIYDSMDSNYGVPDLRDEEKMSRWVAESPECLCNVKDKRLLCSQLKGYDMETTPDFFRWRVRLSAEQIRAYVSSKVSVDLGEIEDLIPVERGASGRLIRLQIRGKKRSIVVGKELEIRRLLSDTHLPSSAFTINRDSEGFLLLGAGWGHGVGLCQIGAAAMALAGADWRQILSHYYPGTNLKEV